MFVQHIQNECNTIKCVNFHFTVKHVRNLHSSLKPYNFSVVKCSPDPDQPSSEYFMRIRVFL